MISVDNITVRFGGFTLLDSVSLMINSRDSIGLVGRNGAGKSTLLKIISGQMSPSTGKIVKSSDTTVGYLPQQMKHSDGSTVFDEAMKAFDHILKMERKIHRISNELGTRTDYESVAYLKLIEKLTTLNEKFEMEGGNSLHADVEKTLIGLGFEPAEMARQTSEFSGGWRMRIELAKILLQNPDIILLDEPTNHLDIESIQWLENFLPAYSGAVVVISHDRAFLDNITNRTVEISLAKLVDYKVPYSKYVELRQERFAQQQAAFNNQRKMIKSTEDFIERFRYKATKAVQVQSRIKQLNRLERLEVEDQDTSVMNIKFPPAPRSGTIVVETKSLSKKYGNKLILDNIDLIIERGEKVAFVGRNGEGKTTLSKIIIAETDYTGECRLGHNVSIGYYAQNQDELMDEEKTVLETIDAVAVGDARLRIRDILGAFLFGQDEIDKKVRVLSGGERSRLSLARMLLQTNNLLVMDEPTNHLDMLSKDILKTALARFDGTLILVSHDRDFLDGLVDKVYEFKDRKVKEHLGGIYDFLQRKKISSLKEIEKKNSAIPEPEKEIVKSPQTKADYQRRKEFDRNLRKLERNLHDIEKEIELLEKQTHEMNGKLQSPENNSDQDLFDKYGKLQELLDRKMQEWEIAHIELEKLQDKRI